MFIGSINSDVRALVSEISRKWQGLPVYVGCSGNFTVERILSKNGIKSIYGNDVSLYSCAIGNYLTGKSTAIDVADPDYEWLTDYFQSDEDTIATLLVCSEYFKFVDKDLPYYRRIAKAYREQFDRMQKETVEVVKKALEGISLAGFCAGDVIDFIENAPQECVAISFPPTYKGGYEKLYTKFDEVFDWDKPEYELFDEGRFQDFHDAVMSKKYWVIIKDREVEDLSSYLMGRVQTALRSKPVYLYSNTEASRRLTVPRQATEKVPFKRATGELNGELRIVHLTRGQLNTLRSEYLAKGILPASADSSFGILVGEELIGAVAVSRSSYSGGWCDAYMMSDFCIRPSIYKRLSKLVLVAALSTEMQEIFEQALGIEIKTVGTTAFTQKSVSMKYRGLFEVYSRKEGALNYIAQAGRWSLKEGYEWWKNKHGQTVNTK